MSDTPTPPDDAALIPVTAFKAFHNNFVGVSRTGEMKLTFTIPTDDIHDALDVATARDEILWVQVSKIRFAGAGIQQLAEKVAEQTREREELGVVAGPDTTSPDTTSPPDTPFPAPVPKKKVKKTPTPASELDWET